MRVVDRSGGPRQLGPLIEALEDENDDVKSCAEGSLALMGKGAVLALHEALGRLSDRAQLYACKAILDIEPEDQKSFAILVKQLKNRNVAIRKETVSNICSLTFDIDHYMFNKPRWQRPGWKVLVRALLETWKDPDQKVRGYSVEALGHLRFNPEQIVPVLIQALHDRDEEVRIEAVRSLGNFEEKAVAGIQSLINALETDSYDVQLEAIDSLSQIGPAASEVVPILQKLIKSSDPEINSGPKLLLLLSGVAENRGGKECHGHGPEKGDASNFLSTSTDSATSGVANIGRKRGRESLLITTTDPFSLFPKPKGTAMYPHFP